MRLAPECGLTKFSINFDGADLSGLIDGSVKSDVCSKLEHAKEISFTCIARQPADIRDDLLDFAAQIFTDHSAKQSSSSNHLLDRVELERLNMKKVLSDADNILIDSFVDL